MRLDTPQPSDFDPYYRWLGIPRGQRPPNYYRLLGISPKEGDHEIIKAAVERQTLLVKNQKQPEQEQIATRLLYEIQEAGMVLLDPYRRKEYDAFLEQSKPSSKQHQIPEPFPPYQPYQPAGEGSELVRSYFGIVSILLAAFIIMAAVSFYLPWQKVIFNRPEKEAQGNPQNVQAVKPQPVNIAPAQPPQVAAKGGGIAAAPKGAAAPKQDEVAEEAVEPATIEAMITAVDAPGRSITVSRNSKTVALDVSRVAKITIDGVETAVDALHPGQTASIDFDPKLDVATKIEVASAGGKTAPAKQEPSPAANDAVKESEAALATVEVTLQQIDSDGRKLTVTRNSKTTAFDVSRKASIVVGGKSVTLDSLRPGQKATIAFDPENEVVARVEVAGSANESPTTPPTSILEKPGAAPSDELTTSEATIASVDASKRSISITRKSKTTAFDVSRKAEIIMDAKAATLDALKPGQKATITINTQADVVVKIEITAAGLSKKPQK